MNDTIKPYRPSNGSEGFGFMADFCDKCTQGEYCEIQMKTMIYDVEDAEYPVEWVCNPQPVCTAFVPIKPTTQSTTKEYEVDISFHGNLTFYVDAENEVEAKEKAFANAGNELNSEENLEAIIFDYTARELD